MVLDKAAKEEKSTFFTKIKFTKENLKKWP